MQINRLKSIFSSYIFCRVCLDIFVSSGGGSIVNNSSMVGLRGSASAPVYSASKHAICGLTKSFAVTYARQGVRVNTVCPGIFPTDIATDSSLRGLIRDNQHPIGRCGNMEEVVKPTLFLLGDDSSFITGADISIDGGM